MGLSTKNFETTDVKKYPSKRAAIKDLRQKHELLFNKEGVGLDARFMPRMKYCLKSL